MTTSQLWSKSNTFRPWSKSWLVVLVKFLYKSARVHLATTKESAFVRNRTPAKASVVVTPHSGRVVSSSRMEAIVHMVSSSVPHLDADNVVVVDQRGNLLTDANRLPGMQMSNVQIEHKRVLEETYRSRIDALLGPIVGESNLRAEVDFWLPILLRLRQRLRNMTLTIQGLKHALNR